MPLNDKNLEVFGINKTNKKLYHKQQCRRLLEIVNILRDKYDTFTDWLDAIFIQCNRNKLSRLRVVQYVSRYLNKYYNVSYYKFYDTKYIVENKELFLNYFYSYILLILEGVETKDYSSRKRLR